MIIFGGFYKVANELNDLHIFDLENQTWKMIHEEPSVFNSYIPSKVQTGEMNTYRGVVSASHNALPAYE